MRRGIAVLLAMILLVLCLGNAAAGGHLCPGPERCPDGDVRWVVYNGGHYRYTNGSASVWGSRDIVYWSHDQGYVITGLCVQTWRGLWTWDLGVPQHGWLDDAKGPICEVVVTAQHK